MFALDEIQPRATNYLPIYIPTYLILRTQSSIEIIIDVTQEGVMHIPPISTKFPNIFKGILIRHYQTPAHQSFGEKNGSAGRGWPVVGAGGSPSLQLRVRSTDLSIAWNSPYPVRT